MDAIVGARHLSQAELRRQLERGARVVVFPFCISIILFSFRRRSAPIFVPVGERPGSRALPFIFLSLWFGWWGFPVGPHFTLESLSTCFRGGEDVTSRYLSGPDDAGAVEALPVSHSHSRTSVSNLSSRPAPHGPGGAVRRTLGGVLVAIGGAFSLGSVMLMISPTHPTDRSGGVALLVFCLSLLIGPGALMILSGRKARRDAERLEQLRGLIHTHGWLTLETLATTLGLEPPAAEAFVERAIGRWGLELTWFPAQRRYLPSAELGRLIELPAGRCPRCDAPMSAKQILPGESAQCEYCNAPVQQSA